MWLRVPLLDETGNTLIDSHRIHSVKYNKATRDMFVSTGVVVAALTGNFGSHVVWEEMHTQNTAV